MYLKKRAGRLFPPYWAAFAAVAAVAAALPAWRDALPNGPGAWAASLLLIPRDPAAVGGTGAEVIVVAWTLQYELAFYVSFALLILDRRFAAPLAVAAAGLWAAGRGWFPGVTLAFPLSFLAGDGVPIFGFGAVAAVAAPAIGGRAALAAGATGAAAILLLVARDLGWSLPGTEGPLGAVRGPLYGAASAALILGLAVRERLGADLGGGAWLRAVGDASYSLYLIHFPLVSLGCKAASAAGLTGLPLPQRAVAAVVSAAVIAAACVAAGVLFHRRVEVPLVRLARRAFLPGHAGVRPPQRPARRPDE